MAFFRIVYGLMILIFLGMSSCFIAGEDPLTDQELALFDFKIEIGLTAKNGENKLSIKESFNMPRKEIVLKLPNIFLRTERLYDRITDLKVSDGATFREHERDPSLLVIEQTPGRRVELSYLFGPHDLKNYPKQESFSAPIIRTNYFQFVGLMALAYPLPLMDSKPFSLELKWNMPNQFQVVNSFGGGGKVQKLTTDFDKLRDALFVGGNDLRSYSINVRNRPVYLTIEGDFAYIKDEEFVDVIKKLLTTQRQTWQDDDFPFFFINILSNNQPCSGNIKFAGTAHTNSFRAFFPSGCPFLPEMKQLISHELMHMWIGKKIKVGHERGNIDGKWFTEGWTDFFGRQLAYNAGVITEKSYFDSLNRQLEKYSLSTENKKPLRELVDRMYRKGQSNRDLEDMPYQQGEIMALNLNKRIKVASNFNFSLEDVVRDMLKESKKEGGSKHFTINEIQKIVDKYDLGANSFLPDYAKIENGEILYPPLLEQCRAAEKRPSRYARMWHIPVYTYGQALGTCSRWLK